MYTVWAAYMFWKAQRMLKGIWGLEQQYASPPDDVHFRKALRFSRTMQNHILQLYNSMASWFKSPGAELTCLQSRTSPIENIWHIIKWKIHQRRPWTLQQLETYIRQEWTNSNPKLQKLITLDTQTSSNCFEKKRRCYTHGKHAPRPNYFETCSRHQIEMSSFCA